MGKVIDRFAGKHWFLSNFFPCVITYCGITFQNAEAAFHAQKCPERAAEFANLDPSAAKRLGRRVKLRADWEDVKDDIMAEILGVKFRAHPGLRDKLLATGDKRLIEGNTWGDTYWGVSDGKGKNRLGELLMELRDALAREV